MLGTVAHPEGMATGIAGTTVALFSGDVALCGSGTAVLDGEVT